MMKMKYRYETNDRRRIVGRSLTRNVACSPRKLRLVINEIREKSVPEALEILQFMQRPSAVPYVMKALKAAVASAQEQHGNPEQLFVGEAIVNEAPTMKRIRPASMGRAVRVRKRHGHIFIGLTEY